MLARMHQACADGVFQVFDGVRLQAAAGHNAAQRYGMAGCLFPPRAKVDQHMQAVLVVGEATLVNDNTGINFALRDSGHDLVKGQRSH